MRRALFAFCCALLCEGCSPPNPCFTGGGAPSPGPGGGPGGLILDDSSPVSVSFSATTVGCAESAQPTSASSDVVDPQNRPLEHTLQFREPTSSSQATAQVTFTAPTPGYYHITVNFLPVGGPAQRDVLVVHDRNKTPPATLRSACAVLHRTTNGLMLCDATAIAPDGGSLPFDPGGSYVVSGDTAWSYDGFKGSLRRFAATDDQLVRSPLYGLPLGQTPDTLIPAGADQVLALSPSSVILVRHQNGALVEVATLPPVARLGEEYTATALGNFLYVAIEKPDEGVEGTGGTSRICSYAIKPGGLGSPDGGSGNCWNFLGAPAGAGKDGFWTWSEETRTLRLVAPGAADGGLTVVESVPLSMDLNLVARTHEFERAVRPVFGAASFVSSAIDAYVPRRLGSAVVLDHYRVKPSEIRAAQDDLVWFSEGTAVKYWPTEP